MIRRRVGAIIRSARLAAAVLWCFLVAAIAAALDVNIIFGAFIAGIALGSLGREQMAKEKEQIAAFSMGFFVPVYFAIVGYRIDLPGAFDPMLFIGFFVFSTVIEGVCVFLAMRLSRCRPLASWNFAVAMNTRGGPGIVLASIAFDFGLVDERMFVTLVLAAILTSLAAGAWFLYAVDRRLPLMDP